MAQGEIKRMWKWTEKRRGIESAWESKSERAAKKQREGEEKQRHRKRKWERQRHREKEKLRDRNRERERDAGPSGCQCHALDPASCLCSSLITCQIDGATSAALTAPQAAWLLLLHKWSRWHFCHFYRSQRRQREREAQEKHLPLRLHVFVKGTTGIVKKKSWWEVWMLDVDHMLACKLLGLCVVVVVVVMWWERGVELRVQ